MENELTSYGTPAQDTPYSTPVSTPRRVPYRMNPVKMVRQHVPVKILSVESAKNTSPDSDSVSSSLSVNPMKTKRVKCTLQPSSLIHDGIGDQIMPDPAEVKSIRQSNNHLFAAQRQEMFDKITLESLPHKRLSEKLASHDEKSRTVCHCRGDAETIKSNVSSQVAEVDSSNPQQPKENKLVVPTNVLDARSETKTKCNSDVQISTEAVKITHNNPEEENLHDSYHLLPQNIIDDSKLLYTNSERRESRLNESLETKKEIQITQKLLNVAASSFHESHDIWDEAKEPPPKTSRNPEKSKRNLPYKKPIPIEENFNAITGHKCDKKKFYDPTDIRKYMMKKKYERQAKEKEEKCKKANELAAQKRKTEISKMFTHRSRLPLPHNLGRENNLVKDVPENLKISKKLAPPNVKCNARAQCHETSKSKNDAHGYHKKMHKPTVTETGVKELNIFKTNDPEHAKLDDFADINETEKYFQQRFNDIISICAKEASKLVSAELQSTTEGGDLKCFSNLKLPGTSVSVAQNALSSSLDELKFKNPYNFLNILKGKVNLAEDDRGFHDQQNLETLVTPATARCNREESKKTDKRHSSDETYIFKHLKSELRLSDLNLSAHKQQNETHRSNSKRLSSHTYVVPENEARRKSAKVSKNIESKENLDTSFGISGVQPLPSFKPFVSTPLTEKNTHNVPRVLEFSENKERIFLNQDDRISLGKTYTSDVISEPSDQLKNDTQEMNVPSNTNLFQLNSGSLTVQNTSFLLPQHVQLRTSANCDLDQSKLISPDILNSIFNPDLTLTNVCIDEADSFRLPDDLNFSHGVPNDAPLMNSSFVLVELYDQMIKSEDEKLLQILKKIQQQKEALNKYLRTEVFALEIQKNEFRDSKDEEKIKTIKKKQRGILLKVTKSILELDRMKKSVIETVDKRKTDLLKQKYSMKQKKIAPKQRSPISKPNTRPSDAANKTLLVTKQMKTFFGVSSSSCTSIVLENGREFETNTIERNEQFNSEVSDCFRRESNVMVTSLRQEKCSSLKDTATSPIPFAGGISIRLDLDPDKLVKLKNSFADIHIHPVKSSQSNELNDANRSQIPPNNENVGLDKGLDDVQEMDHAQEHKSIKIKRPLSPVVLPPSKKILQIRRMSSSSDLTVPSLNDTTTSDQSDVELRISALQEQLRQRKLEAERLRREEKQLRKEKLRSKEQSLLKQLEAYDEYIKKVNKMLTETMNVSEMKKPLIKQTSPFKHANHSFPYEQQPSLLEPSPSAVARTKNYDNITEKREKLVEEVETNTEDSDKQLRKADSGILIESEVTEPSETVDFNAKLGQLDADRSLIHEKSSETGAEHGEPLSKIDSQNKTVGASEVSPSKNILLMINDLQSEVNSLSEQLYSSDFVEDIPEDIADTKSEVSENVTNDNTSVSIEELWSDHQSESYDRVATPSNEPVPFIVKEFQEEYAVESYTDEETTPKTASIVDSISENEIVESSSVNVSDPQSEFNIRVETIENLESTDSEVRKDVPHVEEAISHSFKDPERTPSPQNVVNVEPSVPFNVTEVTFDASTENEASSDGDFDFYDVKNASDIESVLDFEDDRNQRLSEENVPTQTNRSIVEDIKSASSLENLSDESKITSKFETSDENESKMSPKLIKLDYMNESEGSDVADVNEPVKPFEEVSTMMDGLNLSISENTDDNQLTPDGVKENYETVLTNLRSYFDAKSGNINLVSEEKSIDLPSLPQVSPIDKVSLPIPELPHDSKMSIFDHNLEETDISESLEYDAIPLGSPNDETVPSILDDDFGKSVTFEFAATSELHTLNVPSKKLTQEEVSHEKDRSVEEHLVEDFSIPNLMESTFLVHDHSGSSDLNQSEKQEHVENLTSSATQEMTAPPKHTETQMSDVDLEQITENQTPFLRALQREQDNLLARRRESIDKVTDDLFHSLIEETCTSLINTMSSKMRSCDFGLPPASDRVDVSEIPENLDNVNDDSFDQNKPVLDEFDHNWYEKRLHLDQERLREAEELRLQQLKIEQEIEELQAQQYIPPYIYLREIPNKPPPPYTPPADQSLIKIPSNEEELHDFVSSTIEHVCIELHEGKNIDDIQELPLTNSKISNKNNREVITYRRFLFDLTKEIAKNILEDTEKSEHLPWEEFSRQKVPKPMPNKDELQKIIADEIKVLFGLKSKIGKEKLIIQWSRKRKSDFVDDLLIQELQEEEGDWTNYEKDEQIIKNQITESLLDDLLEDTVLSLKDVFRKKGYE